MAIKTRDYIAKLPVHEQEAIKKEARKLMLEELSLSAIREARRHSQIELANKLGVQQPAVSKIERQTDLYLSTLSNYIKAVGGSVKGKTIGVLGLAFKPNTDDMRDAPSLDIIPVLQAAGARIKAYDPESMHEAGKMLTEVDFCDGPYHAIDGADAMVLITEWDQFRALDFDRVKKLLQSPVVVDLRNVYQPADMARRGFTYSSVGRP